MSTLLSIENLTLAFGGVTAIDRVSLQITQGGITALIGPNGAGKTSLFNCITGFYKPNQGSIRLHDGAGRAIAINGNPVHAARAGIARTFQNIRLFNGMSVYENVYLAAECSGIRSPALVAREALERIRLTAKANDPAESLPYGDRRMLEIMRAVCLRPRLLCLDEPAAGLNPSETVALGMLLQQLARERSITVLLIEHDMPLVMRIADRVPVLEFGRLIADGTLAQVRADPRVIAAYLGEDLGEKTC